MEQALIVILGFLGPLMMMCIIGIFYGIYINKKERVQ
jgi:hypothetical protein